MRYTARRYVSETQEHPPAASADSVRELEAALAGAPEGYYSVYDHKPSDSNRTSVRVGGITVSADGHVTFERGPRSS
jgi:hypothetical protein